MTTFQCANCSWLMEVDDRPGAWQTPGECARCGSGVLGIVSPERLAAMFGSGEVAYCNACGTFHPALVKGE